MCQSKLAHAHAWISCLCMHGQARLDFGFKKLTLAHSVVCAWMGTLGTNCKSKISLWFQKIDPCALCCVRMAGLCSWSLNFFKGWYGPFLCKFSCLSLIVVQLTSHILQSKSTIEYLHFDSRTLEIFL